MDLSDPYIIEYNAEDFKKLERRGMALTGKRFNACTFTKCVFAESVFRSCAFHDCSFKSCDLGLAKFPSTAFTTCKMDNCRLDGINWTESGWGGKIFFKPVDFTGCVLNYSTFMGLDLKHVILRKCLAREVSFEEADLSKADCRGTDFDGARFAHTNLSEADFSGAINYAITPANNILKKTKFSLPEAMSLLHALDIVLTDGEEEV
jgi:fluoroquinolone resistance protein